MLVNQRMVESSVGMVPALVPATAQVVSREVHGILGICLLSVSLSDVLKDLDLCQKI